VAAIFLIFLPMAQGIYEFMILPEHERYDYLWQHGVFLLSREDGPSKFNLYACGNFYVEVKYRIEKNCIEGMRTFKNVSQLEPYLFPEGDRES
jgi:hypothetical protein